MSRDPLVLTEWQPFYGCRLSHDDRLQIQRHCEWIELRPEAEDGVFTVRSASNKVGVVALEDFSVVIKPSKCSPELVVFMMGYAKNPVAFKAAHSMLSSSDDVWEATVSAFTLQLRRALKPGLHRGYRQHDEALPVIRGRVRIEEQMRRHYRLVPPVEVTYDDYTEDILENRLLLAAIRAAHRMPLKSGELRRTLRHHEAMLANVQLVEFERRYVPTPRWTRLNMHLQQAVELARLIIAQSSISLGVGGTASPTFIVDMADVFEDFVVAGLRERLGLTEHTFRQGTKALRLAPTIPLEPDFSWWGPDGCLAIGDVKYKKVKADGVLHPDLYQVFAYVTAAQLPSATLIYAKGEGESVTHMVDVVDRQLHVEILDLSRGALGAMEELKRVADLLAGKPVASDAA